MLLQAGLFADTAFFMEDARCGEKVAVDFVGARMAMLRSAQGARDP